jgi:hypothetical protein
MKSQNLALQLILVPHRPVHTDEEINRDLAPAFGILQKSVFGWRRSQARADQTTGRKD